MNIYRLYLIGTPAGCIQGLTSDVQVVVLVAGSVVNWKGGSEAHCFLGRNMPRPFHHGLKLLLLLPWASNIEPAVPQRVFCKQVSGSYIKSYKTYRNQKTTHPFAPAVSAARNPAEAVSAALSARPTAHQLGQAPGLGARDVRRPVAAKTEIHPFP